jgi:hypothetical protein
VWPQRGTDHQGRARRGQIHEILTAAADSIGGLDPAAAAHMMAETIVAGRHDAALTRQAFTRLRALTSSGEASAIPARDAAASAVEMQIRALEWTLSGRNGSAATPQDALNAAALASLSGITMPPAILGWPPRRSAGPKG